MGNGNTAALLPMGEQKHLSPYPWATTSQEKGDFNLSKRATSVLNTEYIGQNIQNCW